MIQFVRRAVLTAVLVLMAGVALAQPANAAAVSPLSSGGGCGAAPEGFKACISASGKSVRPDGYILIETVGCQSVTLYVIDITQGTVFGHKLGCTAGHWGPYPLNGTQYHTYQTKIVMVVLGVAEPAALSPPLNFAD